MIERVEDMPVYQLFFALAQEVEQATRDFGPDFRWLRVQVLRSSESVCANLTEGFYAQERGKGKPGSSILKEDEVEYGEGREDG